METEGRRLRVAPRPTTAWIAFFVLLVGNPMVLRLVNPSVSATQSGWLTLMELSGLLFALGLQLRRATRLKPVGN